MGVSKEKPGPGHYDAQDNRYPEPAKAAFGTGKARGFANVCRPTVPGPGSYRVKTAFDDGPMFSVQSRYRRAKLKSGSLPGPGTYDPSAASNFAHESTSKYRVGTKVGFGTSAREDFVAKHQTPAPGPGRYDLQNHKTLGTESVKFSVTSRRRQHDMTSYLEPGPGMYNSHAGSFGYKHSYVTQHPIWDPRHN